MDIQCVLCMFSYLPVELQTRLDLTHQRSSQQGTFMTLLRRLLRLHGVLVYDLCVYVCVCVCACVCACVCFPVILPPQREEAKCPALPHSCTCTQDSIGPQGPSGPSVKTLPPAPSLHQLSHPIRLSSTPQPTSLPPSPTPHLCQSALPELSVFLCVCCLWLWWR